MQRFTRTSVVAGIIMAGGALLAGADEAKAQCYGGSYVSSYNYGYAPTYVAPAPVYVAQPTYYAPAPTYYTSYAPTYQRSYSRRVVYRDHGHHYRSSHRSHRSHHGHSNSGFGFSFGYSR